MSKLTHPFCAGAALFCFRLGLASAAEAVDLCDRGRKLPASERFVVLAQFNNEAVLDKETQLIWQRSPSTTLDVWATADYQRCAIATIGGRAGCCVRGGMS